MRFEDFRDQVNASGLQVRRCDGHHWQILGGEQLVNVWANSKRGFRYQVRHQNARTGILAHAIQAAGPPEEPVCDTDADVPWKAVARPPEPRLGLIRRFWRWLW